MIGAGRPRFGWCLGLFGRGGGRRSIFAASLFIAFPRSRFHLGERRSSIYATPPFSRCRSTPNAYDWTWSSDLTAAAVARGSVGSA